MAVSGIIMTLFTLGLIAKVLMEVFTKGTTISKIITPLFITFVFGLQMWLVMAESSSACGKVQWKDVLIYGMGYWILIFGGVYLILTMAPGWKQPFSNFFGYMVVLLMGVKTTFNDLLKSPSQTKDPKLNAVIERVYQDKSLLINTLTPSNFDEAISSLKGIFNSGSTNYSENMKRLAHLVFVKDKVAENIWLAMAGWLSLTYAGMLTSSSNCELQPAQLKKHIQDYQQQLKQKEQQKATKQQQQRVQVIRD